MNAEERRADELDDDAARVDAPGRATRGRPVTSLPVAERLRVLARSAHLSPDPAAGEAYAALCVGAMPEVLEALDGAGRELAALRPSAPDGLYDPEADAQRGDVVRSLVAPGQWTYLPDDAGDTAGWRGSCVDTNCGCGVVGWHSTWELPEHLVLVARSVPVAQPPTVPPATDTTATTPTGDL